jgi:hypothetical protein
MATEDHHQNLIAMVVTDKRLQMEIEGKDYLDPNWTQPLLEMFSELHTRGSRNSGRTA